jgi:hypothetical protein
MGVSKLSGSWLLPRRDWLIGKSHCSGQAEHWPGQLETDSSSRNRLTQCNRPMFFGPSPAIARCPRPPGMRYSTDNHLHRFEPTGASAKNQSLQSSIRASG